MLPPKTRVGSHGLGVEGTVLSAPRLGNAGERRPAGERGRDARRCVAPGVVDENQLPAAARRPQDGVRRQDSLARAGEALPENAAEAAVVVAVPDGDEVTAWRDSHGRKLLVRDGDRAQLKLGAEARAAGREALSEDAVTAAVLDAAAQSTALPHDDEAPARVRPDARPVLDPQCEGVDLKFSSEPATRAVEKLAEDPGTAAVAAIDRTLAAPDRQETAGRLHGDGGKRLVRERV
jgi:hypothetical protein